MRCRTQDGSGGGAFWWSYGCPRIVQDGCHLFLSLDRIPQILSMATELEFNVGTMPRINCAAAGNHFPVRGSMKLRKPDGTMLLVSAGHPNPLSDPPSHQLDSSFLGSLIHGTFYRPCPLP